jgi:hypothetical protein
VRPLAPSPAWTLVTPYCKRTRPGCGTNTKAAGFPPLSRPSPAAFSPFALGLAPTHLGWGTRRHFTRRPRDPRSRNADNYVFVETTKYLSFLLEFIVFDRFRITNNSDPIFQRLVFVFIFVLVKKYKIKII